MDANDELNNYDNCYNDCSVEDLKRFLKLRDREIYEFKTTYSKSRIELGDENKELKKTIKGLEEQLKNIFKDGDEIFQIKNVQRDLSTGKHAELVVFSEDGKTISSTTIGALSRESDKIKTKYEKYEKNPNLQILDEINVPFIGKIRYFYYDDDPYKQLYWGVITSFKQNGRNVMAFTEVTDAFMKRMFSANAKAGHYVRYIGSNCYTAVKKRMEKYKGMVKKNNTENITK